MLVDDPSNANNGSSAYKFSLGFLKQIRDSSGRLPLYLLQYSNIQ